MLKEFKEFALRGNVVDLAIGVIIGGAFGGLVASVVADIIMPIIAAVTGGIDFTNLYVQLTGAPVAGDLEAARKAGSVLAYGNFITLVINFVIIAFVLFLAIKAMNAAKKTPPPAPAAPAEPPADVKLLTEIRDLLKKN